MVIRHQFYILILLGGIACAMTYAHSENGGFRQSLRDFIERNSGARVDQPAVREAPAKESTFSHIPLIPDASSGPVGMPYRKGDWSSIIISPRYGFLDIKKRETTELYRDDDMSFISYGSMKLNLLYGRSMFTSSRYRTSDISKPVSGVITPGFTPQQEIQLHMEGSIGDRMTVYIDHDSKSEDNHYLMTYRALKENEPVREINAGEIDIKFNKSKYAVYDNNTSKGLGVDMIVRKNSLQVKAFGSVTRGEAVVETFKGNSSANSVKLADYQYAARTYYQLEPYIRYDGAGNIPAFPAAYTGFNTFTSADPSFTPAPVNLSSTDFAVYMDDQNAYNNSGAIKLSIDGGYYTKLSNGRDYSVNYTTGLITFLTAIPQKARIFVLYNLSGGGSTDPAVNTTIFPGKNFVFIKYGASMDEDADRNGSYTDSNGDGRMNLDVYEVRSRYYLGRKQILNRDFSIKIHSRSRVLSSGETAALGSYSIDYSDGIIYFNLREPFRQLLASGIKDVIYAEKQADSVADSSAYYIKADYYSESRSFQLKHMNIIEGSDRIKINNRVLDKSLYTIDRTSGYLSFNNADNPQISSDTVIEVKYEYLPLGGQSQDFVGGVRADYQLSKNISLGGSALMTRSSGSGVIPLVNSEPVQTIVVEGDTSVNLDGGTLAGFYNLFTDNRKKTLPLEIKGYAEYARSYRNINTFGKGLVENMESSDDSVTLSMSEKNWVLSSMRESVPQSSRGLLYYYYYRDPDDPGSLKGPSYGASAVAYSKKPGPFNVATGHVENGIQEKSSQMSLVFDYDFTSGTQVSVTTRELGLNPVDLSGLQYIEVYYMLAGESSTDSVNFYLDAGSINEDSDGDGILDKEDSNSDGVMQTGEDRGYAFNGNNATVVGSGPGLSSYTSGDGVLNSEDLNGNGTLDTTESTIAFPGSSTTPASIAMSDTAGTWKKARIYVDVTQLSQSQINQLKETEAVRLTLEQASGTRGRLYIDRLRFVSSKWKDAQMDGVTAGPTHLEATYLSSINDAEYRAEAFLFRQKGLYKSLYGSKSDDELESSSESALQLSYNVSGGNHVSIERTFAKTLDIRFYKTLNLWYNCRSFGSGDALRLRIGSSEDDYSEYTFVLSHVGLWQQAKLVLRSGSSGDIEASSVSGNPDFKRISYIRLYIDAPENSGKIWINDIYVSDPMSLESSAHWYETEIKSTQPLFRMKDGTPVLSDFNIKYVHKGHGAQFSSVGQTVNDISERYQQVFTSVNIIPNLSAILDYTGEESETDSLNENITEDLRGRTSRNVVNLSLSYRSTRSGVPSISLSDRSQFYKNWLDEEVSGETIQREKDSFSHAPVMVITEKMDGFIYGTLSTRLMVDLLFNKEDISRSSATLDQSSLESLVSTSESEKRQRNRAELEMTYNNRYFYIRPSAGFSTEELSRYAGKSESGDSSVLTDLRGDFHMPFIYSDSMRFVQRNTETGISMGMPSYGFISPNYSMQISYAEDSFRDYTASELSFSDGFRRCRDARSIITTRIDVPLNMARISGSPGFRFFRSLSASFSRSLYLSEDSVPYEGEGVSVMRERYGIERSLSGLSGAGLNLFRYYPGYFFRGRRSSARGRDYIYNTFNHGISGSSGVEYSDYDNTLKLVENYSLNMFLDFSSFTMDGGLGLNQVCARSNTYGVPQQIITRTARTQFAFNLMELFRFGFFRPNRSGIPHHSATLEAGYSFTNNDIITSNIVENQHSPSAGISFKWDRSYLGLTLGVDLRNREFQSFIAGDGSRSSRDDIYYGNMSTDSGFSELDRGYNFSIIYETDIRWLYDFFSQFYALLNSPILRTEYMIKLKRYDYSETTSPEPYDLYMLSSSLTMDLHKHVRGSFGGRAALENYYDIGTSRISKRVFSYEGSFQFTLLF